MRGWVLESEHIWGPLIICKNKNTVGAKAAREVRTLPLAPVITSEGSGRRTNLHNKAILFGLYIP